jgi:hypothetical protein
MREGLIMAHGHPTGRGIWKHKAGSSGANPANVKLADVSYQNDELAALIVKAWTNPGFRDGLVGDATTVPIATRKANAIAALQSLPTHPIDLASPIVITEAEYDAGWEADDDDQIVFVLPNATRAVGNLVETAKLLMACVPNGI